jgi:hypothetical protein
MMGGGFIAVIGMIIAFLRGPERIGVGSRQL